MSENTTYHMSKVDPADTKLELSCTTVKMNLEYLRDKYGQEEMERFVFETEMNLDYLEDRNNWISFGYWCRFLKKLVSYTGNPNVPYEVGFGDKKESYGALALLTAKVLSAKAMYRIIVRLAPRVNKISTWNFKNRGYNKCEISIRYKNNYSQDRNNCLNLQGIFASVPCMHELPPAKVSHLQCACEGGDSCVYELSWVEGPTRLLGGIGALAGLIVGVVFCATAGWSSLGVVGAISFLLAGYFMGHDLDYKRELKKVHRESNEQADYLEQSLKDIEKLNEGLQKKIEQRTEELTNTNDKLQRTLKDLKESQGKALIAEKQAAVGMLAAGMAHEMNNPINAIRLSIQGLMEDAVADSPVQSQLLVAERATGRCMRIINELLSFSREPRQETNVQIEQILKKSVEVFEKEYSENVRIDKQVASDLPALRLDRLQIQQVILNLLSNALDVMGGKGKIEVSLTSKDGAVLLNIKDQGPGITDSERKKIFDPFFSTKRTTRKGLGLGLSISCQIVRRNGGTIDVESSKDKGTTFVIRFPVEAETGKQPEPEPLPLLSLPAVVPVVDEVTSAPGTLSETEWFMRDIEAEVPGPSDDPKNADDYLDEQIHLLLVEDDVESGETMMSRLKKRGIEVMMVPSAEEGMDKLESGAFDAVVADIRLEGGMSGVDFLRRIRQNRPEFPVILLTGFDSLESAINAVRLGAQDYILKPLDTIEDVLKPLKKAVRSHRLLLRSRRLEKELEKSNRHLKKTLTALKKSQEKIVHQARLSALGQMASGIVHEFNNVLMPIYGLCALLLEDPDSLADIKEVSKTIEMIQAAAEDGKQIVDRLREFYHPDKHLDVTLVDAGVLVSQVIALTKPAWSNRGRSSGGRIDIGTDLQPIPAFTANESQIREVLLNLILNAIDAMPEGGTITLSARQDGEWAVIKVSDTGEGMPEEVRRCCLEPFFSTKGEHGTGLGLAIVKNIVLKHGGTIEIESHLPSGQGPGKARFSSPPPGHGAARGTDGVNGGTTIAIRLPLNSPVGQAPVRSDVRINTNTTKEKV